MKEKENSNCPQSPTEISPTEKESIVTSQTAASTNVKKKEKKERS